MIFSDGVRYGTLADLFAGRLYIADGRRVLGLVPDGVTTVVLRYPSGQTITASVRNNFFEITNAPLTVSGRAGAPLAPSPPAVRWLDSDGKDVGPPSSG
jgi:hypothetical protein